MHNLDNLIPQQPPMRLIDKVISFDNDIVHCQTTITDEHLFFCPDKKSIHHWTAIEIMSQTAAAYGKLKTIDVDTKPTMAFLLSVRKYTTTVTHYTDKTVLDVYAECIISDNGTGVFSCKIQVNGVETASVTINAHQPQNTDDAQKIITRSI